MVRALNGNGLFEAFLAKRFFLEDLEEAFWCLRKISSDFGQEKKTNISSESCC